MKFRYTKGKMKYSLLFHQTLQNPKTSLIIIIVDFSADLKTVISKYSHKEQSYEHRYHRCRKHRRNNGTDSC